MPKRIVVTVTPEARLELEAIADRLMHKVNMRVGASFPRQGTLVGEVKGQMEVDRIAGMVEVASVRVHDAEPFA